MQVGCQCSLKAIERYCNAFNTAACGTTCFVLLALPRNTHAKLVVRVMKQMSVVFLLCFVGVAHVVPTDSVTMAVERSSGHPGFAFAS